MPWVVGIDEAGYGPNLGPLVQTAVAVRLPSDDLAGWTTLKEKIRRANERDDGRVLVDDSKAIYAGGRKLERLARGLQPFPTSLAAILASHGLPESIADLAPEYWHSDEITDCESRRAVVDFGPRAINLVMPARFNRIVAETDNKAVVLTRGFLALLQSTLQRMEDDDPVTFVGDKHGGRHYYAPLLQDTFPTGWVVADRESPDESRYRILNLDREVTVIFRPRADGDSMSVALASMTAKYLRELCMRQFNAFWAKHVPGLQPTAGYPVDAKRFYREIEPAMKKLGIPKDAVWRIK